jgi:hypothetical protein
MHHSEDGRALTRLLEARLPDKRYGVFFSVGEGSFFPNGVEESSGSVVTEDGDHYSYWTGWDDAGGCETFATWTPIDGRSDWLDCDEYRVARRDAGLTD